MANVKLNPMQAAFAAMKFIRDHENASRAIDVALDASSRIAAVAEATKKEQETVGLWSRWMEAGKALAEAGADATIAKLVIEACAGEKGIAASSIATYRSLIPSLLPAFKMSDDEFAAAWNAAGITNSKGEPVPPTRNFNNQQCRKLIRVINERPIQPQDRLNEGLKAIAAHIKALAKPDTEGLDEAHKNLAKLNGMKDALETLDILINELGVDTSSLPVINLLIGGRYVYGPHAGKTIQDVQAERVASGEELPDVEGDAEASADEDAVRYGTHG